MRQDLNDVGLLDGQADARFDRLLRLGATALGVSWGLLVFVDQSDESLSRKGAISVSGDGPPDGLMTEACRSVLQHGALRTDVVHGSAWLGAPIHDPTGHVIGALCMGASVPRAWTGADVETASTLAQTIEGQLAQRLTLLHTERARHGAEATAQALELATRRFRDLAENVPGSIYQYVEHPDGRTAVEFMTPGSLAIWEVEPEDVVHDASALWATTLPEDLADLRASVDRSARDLSTWHHRWRIRTHTGKLKWVQGHGRPMRGADGSTIWNSLVLDVTVEVEAQQRLAENTRLLVEASKQEAIGRLAGGIAHDFNNLLSIVLANAERLVDRSDEAPEILAAEIGDAARAGAELTRRLLSFARRADLHPTIVDLNQVVTSMNNLLRRSLPENIAIETSLMAGLWKTRTDRSFLESALLNLVVNARDALQRGGRLTIETANVRLTDEYVTSRREEIPAGRHVMLAVTDTGVGIAPEVLPHIFEPFFTTRANEGGTGLGLAMVYGFARQSGGTVRVYSEPGRGTSFKLYLPIDDSEIADERPTRAHITPRGKHTILLVEDQDPVRRVLRRQLEAAGYAVVEAASGDAAIGAFEAANPPIDVILTDVVMPGSLQGPELVALLRNHRRDLPVVYMSGYPHEANVHGNGIRARDISLTKPMERSTLLAALAQVLG